MKLIGLAVVSLWIAIFIWLGLDWITQTSQFCGLVARLFAGILVVIAVVCVLAYLEIEG